jgi:hypothetical protein
MGRVFTTEDTEDAERRSPRPTVRKQGGHPEDRKAKLENGNSKRGISITRRRRERGKEEGEKPKRPAADGGRYKPKRAQANCLCHARAWRQMEDGGG